MLDLRYEDGKLLWLGGNLTEDEQLYQSQGAEILLKLYPEYLRKISCTLFVECSYSKDDRQYQEIFNKLLAVRAHRDSSYQPAILQETNPCLIEVPNYGPIWGVFWL